MKENINQGLGESHRPEQNEEATERLAIIHGRTGIGIRGRWFGRNGVIGRADRVGTVSTIDTDATLAFTDCPLKGIDK
jgi:hypothetical protein